MVTSNRFGAQKPEGEGMIFESGAGHALRCHNLTTTEIKPLIFQTDKPGCVVVDAGATFAHIAAPTPSVT